MKVNKEGEKQMLKWLFISLLVVVSMLILFVIVSSIARVRFKQSANKEVNRLFNGTLKNNHELIRKEDLANLPEPVQKWLESVHIIGKEKTTTVRLKQKGLMRIKEDGSWMTAQAEQYFRTDEPGFVWVANVQMAPLLHFSGMDKYQEGKGKMSIKVLSLFSVVEAKGSEIDESTLLRYLAEMQWFPTAALNSYIKWDSINANSARATMSYKGITASGVFSFNENGDLISFKAKRYKEGNGKYVLTDWGGVNKKFKEFNGIRIPTKSDIIWYERTGEFNWFQLEVTEVEYNQPAIYET